MTDDEVLLTHERAHPQNRSASGFVALRRVSSRRACGGWPTRGGEAQEHCGMDGYRANAPGRGESREDSEEPEDVPRRQELYLAPRMLVGEKY